MNPRPCGYRGALNRLQARLSEARISCNAEIDDADVRSTCALDAPAMDLIRVAMVRGVLFARAFDRIARVTRTIADPTASKRITRDQGAEAPVYRMVERGARLSAAYTVTRKKSAD